jgi:hypothetical protein
MSWARSVPVVARAIHIDGQPIDPIACYAAHGAAL